MNLHAGAGTEARPYEQLGGHRGPPLRTTGLHAGAGTEARPYEQPGRHRGPPLRTTGPAQRPAPTNNWAGTEARPYEQPGGHRGPPLRTTWRAQRPAPTNNLAATEGRRYVISNNGSPPSTAWPGETRTLVTVPPRSAWISFCIFIASSTTRPWPAVTLAPGSTSTLTTRPGM